MFSTRMISRKAAQIALFLIENEERLGGVGIFLAKKWVESVL